MESLRAAILYGADAVYLGGKLFGLRANSGFGEAELALAVKIAHEAGVKAYLTCNVVADNFDADLFPEFIKIAAKTGIDAVIVSDMGLFGLVQKHAPELKIHVSTQAGVMNYAACDTLYELGAGRVVLARETSLEQIRRIRDKTNPALELEAFVHGAMCVSFSGRCLLSAYMADRNANQGNCAHPCRWNYSLVEETRPGAFLSVFEDERGSYILNAKDLCMIEHIGELKKAGLDSFKIEGRAKTAYYAATVTNAYRAAMDACGNHQPPPDWVKREVDCVSHRPYSTGFYFGQAEQCYESAGYTRECDFIGTVSGYGSGFLEITQRGYFTAGDYIEIVRPGLPPERLDASGMLNERREPAETANRAVEKLFIPYGKPLPAGIVLRRVK